MQKKTNATGTPTSRRPGVGHHSGFWIVAVVFLAVMAYSTIPTPLYPLYQQRDHFPAFTITVIFAAYALGVVVSLFLAGHVSDWLGRRRILLLAVLLSVVAAVMFLFWQDVPGLVVARVVDGASVGIITATATAHLTELRAVAKPRESPVLAASVAGAANLGGLSLGPLIGGVFADFLPDPLMLPHLVFLLLLLAAALVVLVVPETVFVEGPRRPYRPQRVSVPKGAGGSFAIAAFGAFSAFAVLGLFTSLAPTFLVVSFGATDHLLAGATTFAVFAAAAAGQIALAALPVRIQITLAMSACLVGLGLVAGGGLGSSLVMFIGGGVVSGLGVGLLFKSAVATAISLAPAGRKGETLALIFLIAYAGLAIPVLLVGIALSVVPPTPVLLVFIAIVLAATVTAGALMRARTLKRSE